MQIVYDGEIFYVYRFSVTQEFGKICELIQEKASFVSTLCRFLLYRIELS